MAIKISVTTKELEAMPTEDLRKMKQQGLEAETKSRELRGVINDILHVRNIDAEAEKKKQEFLARHKKPEAPKR